MLRIARSHLVVICLFIGTLGVCLTWGGQSTTTALLPDEASRAAAWQSATENSEVTLTGAISRKGHGAVGEFDINLPLDTYAEAGVEPRSGGLTQVVLTFSGPADGIDVQASAGTVGAVLVEGSQATVELSGVPNATCLVLTVSGVTGMGSEVAVHIRALAGDVTGDGSVNILDLVQIRNQLNQEVAANNFQADVNRDGTINILDLVGVRNRLNTAVQCDPPPPPGMVRIPAGEFLMGDHHDGLADAPVHAVYLSAFYMDRYEVTNQQYAEALNWAYAQGGHIDILSHGVFKADAGTSFFYCSTSSFDSQSSITLAGSPFGVIAGRENHPMMMVGWYGAAVYTNWRSAMQGLTPCYDLTTWSCNFDADGYRLPTEAEWEKAARGGAVGRRFPWADEDTIQHARANYYSWSGCAYDTSPTREHHPTFRTQQLAFTNPVDYFTPNGYGLYGMAGNTWEWCNDWYDGNYYSSSPYANPRGPASGQYRTWRGGGWNTSAEACRVANRYSNIPWNGYGQSGFRCAAGTQ